MSALLISVVVGVTWFHKMFYRILRNFMPD
jgi:hypothetical protein